MPTQPDPNEPVLLTLELTPELEEQFRDFCDANGVDDDEALTLLLETALEARREARRRG
jgi:hypothetical protein